MIKLTIQKKLFIGFGAVLVIMTLVSIINIFMIRKVSEDERRLMDLRMPTVLAGMQLTNGIHLSLAGLRGYMLLGDDPVKAQLFRAERKSGWSEINQAMSKMEKYATHWTDPKNIKLLDEMKKLLNDFNEAQQQIETISHSPENIPAFKILLTEAAPRAAKILSSITAIINEESNQPVTFERKRLLKLLADSRGSFSMGLANIRAYLLSGDLGFADNFHAKWQLNEARFKEISTVTHLFSSSQRENWDVYKSLRAEFSSLPSKMFDLRSANDWNLANYWLGSKAAPKAGAILSIIKKMRKSQDELAAIDLENLEKDTAMIQVIMIMGAIIALLLGVGIAVFISRIIVQRLQVVVERTQHISSGDLTGKNLPVKGGDEISDLTVAINHMSHSLKKIIEKILESAQQLSHSSGELSSITQKTSQCIFDQTSQTEQVATAMNEMSATVHEVNRNIASSAQAADEANRETVNGCQVVNDAVLGVQKLAAQLETATGVIHKLEQDSEDINAVLDVIKGVAEQTNLLALNAAIEAARAGEQGRGFAVVADEVRTLAGRTQQSTEEINQVIEKLQGGSRKAVDVMNKSREEAKIVVEQAQKAGESLSAITKKVTHINDMSAQIASAAEQQTATSEEINRNILNISNMANETSDGAHQTTLATENLTRLGSELQALVGEFRA